MTDRYAIRWHAAALADLDAEYRHSVKAFGSPHADNYFERLFSIIDRLASLPNAHSPLRGFPPGWRVVIVDGLMIPYRVRDDRRTVELFGLLGRDRYHALARLVRDRTVKQGGARQQGKRPRKPPR